MLPSDILGHFIFYLVNKFQNTFISKFSEAKIRPIYQVASNLDVCKYRPVSLLSGMSKKRNGESDVTVF